jgi:hypothetical protein
VGTLDRMEITEPATRPDVPSVRDVATLRRLGALPPEQTAVPILTKALTAPSPSGPVLARLDPGQLRAPDGAATVYLYSPTRIDTYHGPELVMWGDGPFSAHLHLEFWNVAAGSDAVVSVTLRVGTPDQAVRITATGNPTPMLVSHAATAGAIVTIPVPVHVTADWCVVVLEPAGPDDTFAWYGADLRLL